MRIARVYSQLLASYQDVREDSVQHLLLIVDEQMAVALGDRRARMFQDARDLMEAHAKLGQVAGAAVPHSACVRIASVRTTTG